MPKVTDFNAKDELGNSVLCDAFGNNVAFQCLNCGGPVLAIVRENQRGSSKNNPSQCPKCSRQFWLAFAEVEKTLVVHTVG